MPGFVRGLAGVPCFCDAFLLRRVLRLLTHRNKQVRLPLSHPGSAADVPRWFFTFRSELGCGLFPESQSKAQGYGFPPPQDAALPRDALTMVHIMLRVLCTHL